MSAVRIRWSQLLMIPELDIVGVFPKEVPLADEIVQTLSLLTAVNRAERKMVRCDRLGSLLMSDAWNLYNAVQAGILEVDDSTEDTVTATTANEGVLISTGLQLGRVEFERVTGVSADIVYVPANSFYWYPHSTYLVKGQTVPYASGGATVIGVTFYN